MEIKNVELQHTDAVEAGKDKSGLAVAAVPASDMLLVTFDDDSQAYVPIDPVNRHYNEAKAWWKNQSKKPFKWPKVSETDK